MSEGQRHLTHSGVKVKRDVSFFIFRHITQPESSLKKKKKKKIFLLHRINVLDTDSSQVSAKKERETPTPTDASSLLMLWVRELRRSRINSVVQNSA